MHGVEIRIGHVLDELGKLEDGSVQCVVTSPPYWGLRDYGLEPVVWGGEPACGHEWVIEMVAPQSGGTGPASRKQVTNAGTQGSVQNPIERSFCIHCSAWRGSLGLEPTPELYVEHMTAVFREVRRVLRADGVVFLNLGDSYASGGNNSGSTPEALTEKQSSNAGCRYERRAAPPGLKPKDLVMIPARVAIALQADGWYLRSEIVWAKPNPMPESVRDRPTKAHEMMYLLSKSQRYYYDQEAVAEPPTGHTAKKLSWQARKQQGELPRHGLNGASQSGSGSYAVPDAGRNLRSVWTIPTAPYPEAHFATFPPALVEPCIKAGTAPGDTVLDPFAGSGTVGEVARRWGRKSILIEAQPKYRKLIEKRLRQGVLIA